MQSIPPGLSTRASTNCQPHSSQDSELTRQSVQQGLTAKLFGFAEGDLSGREGRRNSFFVILLVIIQSTFGFGLAPPADPGANVSAELRNKILQDRKDNLWQISLARFLCDHQVSRQKRLHCEQPQGSHMLKPVFSTYCARREAKRFLHAPRRASQGADLSGANTQTTHSVHYIETPVFQFAQQEMSRRT